MDNEIYLPAELFFPKCTPFGLTFDDVSLATLSELLPKDVRIDAKISEEINSKYSYHIF